MQLRRNTKSEYGIAIRFRIGLSSILMLSSLGGCNDGNPFSQVKVSGHVLYEDGSVIPVDGLKLWFDCQEPPKPGGMSPRVAAAPVNVTDGSFDTATTYRYGDGLVRGKHKVFLDIVPKKDGPPQPVPPQYTAAATTTLIIDTAQLPLQIRVPKP
jgi:hypothetical protein